MSHNIRHLEVTDTLRETTDVTRKQAFDIEQELYDIESRLNKPLNLVPKAYNELVHWPWRTWRRMIAPMPSNGFPQPAAKPSALQQGDCTPNTTANPGYNTGSKSLWPAYFSVYSKGRLDEFNWVRDHLNFGTSSLEKYYPSTGLLFWYVEEEPTVLGYAQINRLQGIGQTFEVSYQGTGTGESVVNFNQQQSGGSYQQNPTGRDQSTFDGMYIKFMMVY